MNLLARTRVLLPVLTLAFAASTSGAFAATYGYDSVSNVQTYTKDRTYGAWSGETVTGVTTETVTGADGRDYLRTITTYEKSREVKDSVYETGTGTYKNRESLSFDLDSRFRNVDKGDGINRGQWVYIDGEKVHSDTTVASGNWDTNGSEARWGKKFGQWAPPTYDQQSRYNVETGWHPYGEAGRWLKLADFTHTNRNIWKPIVGADLDLRIDIGNGASVLEQTWDITHDETFNLNSPTSDHVTMSTNQARQGYILDSLKIWKGNTLFTVWITNFQNTDFWTAEDGQTTTSLFAYFTSQTTETFNKFVRFAYDSEIMTRQETTDTLIPTPAPVPLPAGLPLLLAGMGSIVLLRRGRKAKAA